MQVLNRFTIMEFIDPLVIKYRVLVILEPLVPCVMVVVQLSMAKHLCLK